MQCTQRTGTPALNGKYFLAGGIVAAGLMAAGVAGASTAAAAPDDTGSTTHSASAADSASAGVVSRPSRLSPRGKAREAEERATETPQRRVERPSADADDATGEDGRPLRRDRTRRAERATTDETARPSRTVTSPTPQRSPDAAPATSTTSEVAVAPAALTAARTSVTASSTTPDAVLLAAATSTRVTVGSMIVDKLYAVGIRSRRMGSDWLDIPVSAAKAQRWLVRRQDIYRDVLNSQPTEPPVEQPPGTSQPKLLWETNFSSREEALKYWGSQTGRWGQSAGENQYYTDGNNITVDADGNLVIQVRRERTPDGLGAPYNYTSARLVTYGKQSIGVGTRVEARIQVPPDSGLLPAFWTVGLEPGHEFDWPRQGEIDIMEIPGFGTPASRSTWTGNIHGPAKGNNNVDVKMDDIDADLGVDLSAGFHTYGMDWYADRIIWRVDGVEVGQVTKAQYEARGGDWTPFSGQWEHYLILNVAVGNPWTGDPSASQPMNAEMKVDWVRAYQL